MAKQTSKTLAAAVGAALIASVTASSALSAGDNPFQLTDLGSGYSVAGDNEGKCGEGKCGEGKESSESGHDGHEAADDTQEPAKAEGEGKCGEGKCGGDKEDDAS